MGMILRIASSRIVGQGDIVGRSGYFSLNLSANSVMRGRLDARRTLKSLVADLRVINNRHGILKRRERDSNPRNPLGVYTLSRRASSTTRASLQKRATASLKRVQNTKKIAYPNVSVHKSIVFA